MKIFKEPNNSEMTYSKAIWNAIGLSMEKDDKIVVYGLGVDDHTAMYGTTKDYTEYFGKNRCFDTPLSEDAMTGFGVGMALRGYRPIHVHQRADFITLCMNQLINMAAKIKYVSNETQSCPLIVRCIIGRSWGQGAQHSQSLYSLLSNIPGITVLVPSTPKDAYNCYHHALQKNEPFIIFEHRMLYKTISKVYIEKDLPTTSKINQGDDITICSFSHATYEAQRAIEKLSEYNINCDHFSVVNTSKVKTDDIIQSVNKTKKLLIVENGWINCSVGQSIMAKVAEESIEEKLTLRILGYKDHPCPTAKNLENDYYADAQKVANKVLEMMDSGKSVTITASEALKSFKGPF